MSIASPELRGTSACHFRSVPCFPHVLLFQITWGVGWPIFSVAYARFENFARIDYAHRPSWSRRATLIMSWKQAPYCSVGYSCVTVNNTTCCPSVHIVRFEV